MKSHRLSGLLFWNSFGHTALKILDVAVSILLLRWAGVTTFGVMTLLVIVVGAVDVIFSFDVESACIQGRKKIEWYMVTGVVSHAVLRALGLTKITSLILIYSLLIMVIIIYPFAISSGIMGVAWSGVVMNFIVMPLLYFTTIRYIRISTAQAA